MQWTIHILELIHALKGFELVHFDNHSVELIPEKCSISAKKLYKYKRSKVQKVPSIDIYLLKVCRVFSLQFPPKSYIKGQKYEKFPPIDIYLLKVFSWQFSS